MTDSHAVAPTVAEIREIAGLTDPVVRNLRVTLCYHELATAMSVLIGPGANWCTVATWASKQAGQTIRKGDLAHALADLVAGSPAAAQAAGELRSRGAQLPGGETRSLAGTIAALWEAISPAAAFQRTSDAVALGNRKVFEEIGYEFARFLTSVTAGRADEAMLVEFCEGLRAGEPPGGQGWLRQAFTHYYQALVQPGAQIRAELLLLANLEIGFHEQTRLQPQIAAALDAPIYDPAELRQRLLAELFPDPTSRVRLALLRLFGRAGAILRARDRLADELQRLGRLVITEQLMTLWLPGGRMLRLGQDLRAAFPQSLAHPTHPPLLALLRQVDPTPDSLHQTGAQDWGRLPDRMHFIADLFRAYHLDETLFDPPFTADQVAAMRIGHLPTGRL